MNSTILWILIIGGLVIVYEIIQIIRIETLRKKCQKLKIAIERYWNDTGDVDGVRMSDVEVDDFILNDITAWKYTDLIEPEKFEKIEKYLKGEI